MKGKGINYTLLRLGITSTSNGSDTRVDKNFDNYVQGARANNIEVGAYYFSKALSVASVQNEANFVVSVLNKYPNGTFSLPIYIAYELESNRGNESNNNYYNEFCKILNNSGYYCGVYTWSNNVNKKLLNDSVKSIWIPSWTQSKPSPGFSYDIWQFAAPEPLISYYRPSCYGASTCDENKIFNNLSKIIINSGYNNFK